MISPDPLVSGFPLWVSLAQLVLLLRAVQWAVLAQSTVVCGTWCPENETHLLLHSFTWKLD